MQNDGLIILIDGLETRRTCTTLAFEPWAKSLALDLISCAPDDIDDKLVHQQRIRLVLINAGETCLRNREQQKVLERAKAVLGGPCAVITHRGDADDAIAVAELGYHAFLPASLAFDMAKNALTFVINGGTYFPSEAVLAMNTRRAKMPKQRPAYGSHVFTARETSVLEQLCDALSNKHIGRRLNMEESTVKVHVRHIMRKLGVSNRTQAALRAQSLKQSQTHTQVGLAPGVSVNLPQAHADLPGH